MTSPVVEKSVETIDTSKFRSKLEHEHKELIILRLAEFRSRDEIIQELQKRYSIEVTTWAIDYYARNKEAILAKRDYLNTHLELIPIANKSVRINMLEKDIKKLAGASDLDSLKVKREYLEQVRKEKESLKIDVTHRRGFDPTEFKHLKTHGDLDQAIEESKKEGRAEGEQVTGLLEEIGEGD